MTVEQIMTRQVVSVGLDDSVQTVRDCFEDHHFHHLLVVEHHKLVGVISDRDLLRNLSPFIGKSLAERQQDTATLHRRVHQIMTRKPVSVSPETPIQDAARRMIEHNISCLPVTSPDMRVVGIVTWKDLLRAVVGIP